MMKFLDQLVGLPGHPGRMHCQQPLVNSSSLQQPQPFCRGQYTSSLNFCIHHCLCKCIAFHSIHIMYGFRSTHTRPRPNSLALLLQHSASPLQRCIEPQFVVQPFEIISIHHRAVGVHNHHPPISTCSLSHSFHTATLVLCDNSSALRIHCSQLQTR